MERRYAVEEVREDGGKIRGLAAAYYDGTEQTEYGLWAGARERIMPGAFDRALEEGQDVRALFNHDKSQILGRLKAGTLSLRATPRGLEYEINPGNTTTARDVLEHIRRGDVTGSSFSFKPIKDGGEEWRDVDGVQVRELRSVDLFDVGPVTYPAYASTSVGVRAVDDVEEARKSFDAHHAEERAPHDSKILRAVVKVFRKKEEATTFEILEAMRAEGVPSDILGSSGADLGRILARLVRSGHVVKVAPTKWRRGPSFGRSARRQRVADILATEAGGECRGEKVATQSEILRKVVALFQGAPPDFKISEGDLKQRVIDALGGQAGAGIFGMKHRQEFFDRQFDGALKFLARQRQVIKSGGKWMRGERF